MNSKIWRRTNSRFECSRSHEFSDEYNALLATQRRLPGIVEADNVGVLKPLQHLSLLLETLLLCLSQLAVLI